jgi:plastocyanin
MRIDRQIIVNATRCGGVFVLSCFATFSHAIDLDVSIIDRDGQPVGDVAVYAARKDSTSAPANASTSAVMDQIDMQFVPHLLVIQTGTSVEFPNSDSVAHHVYSFSHPNKFMLPMYKGEEHPPVIFEHSGIVSLGCNIHDHMLGYILVVDSPFFGKTDESGKASLSLDNPQDYVISIWSPRIRDREELLSKVVLASGDLEARLDFALQKKLNPPHGGISGRETWAEY